MARIVNFLIPLSWVLWGIVLPVLLWALVWALVDGTHSPEMSPRLGVLVVGSLLIAFAGVGLFLYWATRRRSTIWLIALTLFLAYLVFMLIAIPSVRAWKTWRFEQETASTKGATDNNPTSWLHVRRSANGRAPPITR